MVSDYRHIAEVTRIYAEPSGRRLIIADTKGEGYLYNPVSVASKCLSDFCLLPLSTELKGDIINAIFLGQICSITCLVFIIF